MSKIPPLLPHETLVRVLRLATLDGLVVLMIATAFAIASALGHDITGAIIGLLIAGGGATELHGVTLIRRGQPRGMNWLVGSQVFLLIAILGYCAVSFITLAPPPLPEMFSPLVAMNAEQVHMTSAEFLLFIQRIALGTVAVVAFFYQGGMALFYYRRREAVERALTEE